MHPLHPLHPTRHRALRLALPLLTVLALAGAAACGEDGDDDTAASDSPADSDTTTTADDAAGGDAAAETTDVVAVDYAFEGLPDRIDAGTTLTLRNDSAAEVHELVAMAIPEDEARPVDELVALPEDQLFAAVPGEPALVLVAPPGEDAVPVLGDGTLEPGRYLLVCAIPTGADPDEFMRQAQESQGPPDVAGGPPHLVHGMYAELVVE